MNNHIKHLEVTKHLVSYESEGFVIMALLSIVVGIALSMVGSLFSLSLIQTRKLILFDPILSGIFAGYIIHTRMKYDTQREMKKQHEKDDIK